MKLCRRQKKDHRLMSMSSAVGIHGQDSRQRLQTNDHFLQKPGPNNKIRKTGEKLTKTWKKQKSINFKLMR